MINMITIFNISSMMFLIIAMIFCDDLVDFSWFIILDSIGRKIALSLEIRRLYSKVYYPS